MPVRGGCGARGDSKLIQTTHGTLSGVAERRARQRWQLRRARGDDGGSARGDENGCTRVIMEPNGAIITPGDDETFVIRMKSLLSATLETKLLNSGGNKVATNRV